MSVPTFIEFINEAGKTVSVISWNDTENGLVGEFFVKDQKFNIEVNSLDNKNISAYQFKFYRDNSVDMFNDMTYALGVVPTIKEAVSYAMLYLEPDILLFASSDNSKARKAMYKAEAENIAKKYKYFSIATSEKLKELGYTSDVIFGVYKNENILNRALEEL